MYKIIDLQGAGIHHGEVFKTKKDIVDHLANYHDIDFTGTDNKENELNISEYFKFWKINTVKKQLDFLLEHGEWEIEKVKA